MSTRRALVLGAWVIGGAIALIGAFVYAELAALRPRVGGQYAYLRDAYHPIVAFLYGWTLLLVVQTGGMAGAAIICGRYFRELTGLGVSEQLVAGVTLGILTLVNCLGVRAGSNLQSALMLTKLAAIAMLIGVGYIMVTPAPTMASATPRRDAAVRSGLATAMVPVLFAYGGWQTASFVSGEMRDPRRDLPRGLLIGVIGVIVLYLAVTYVCLRVLGVDGLAQTQTPASEVMRRALGDRGARLIALGIAISTVGFLSQSILTAPRVYYAMARDGVFFSRRRHAQSAYARAGRRDRAAGRVGGDHRDHRQVRSDPQLRRSDRRAVLRAHRRVVAHLSRARARRRRRSSRTIACAYRGIR